MNCTDIDQVESTLVPVSQIIAELHVKKTSQLEMCREYSVPVAFAIPVGRGYSHYVTKENAQILRDRIADKRAVKTAKRTTEDHQSHTTLAQDVRWIRENMQRLIDALGGIES